MENLTCCYSDSLSSAHIITSNHHTASEYLTTSEPRIYRIYCICVLTHYHRVYLMVREQIGQYSQGRIHYAVFILLLVAVSNMQIYNTLLIVRIKTANVVSW